MKEDRPYIPRVGDMVLTKAFSGRTVLGIITRRIGHFRSGCEIFISGYGTPFFVERFWSFQHSDLVHFCGSPEQMKELNDAREELLRFL